MTDTHDVERLRPMGDAPKDKSYILAVFNQPDESINSHWWSGRAFVIRHEGYTVSGFDLGWSLFPGYGGCTDRMFHGWLPLPPALYPSSDTPCS